MNPTGIEGHLKLVLLEWIIIIAAAYFCGRLGRRWGQPLAVGEIAAGLLLGPSALGLVWPANWPALFPPETQQSLQLLGKLGLVFLLFQVGMEFDYSHLRSRSGTVTAVSLLGILGPVACGLAIGPWLHERFAAETPRFGFQLFLCIALSISALPIMGRILLEMRLERTAIGALAISAAAVDDVIGWILLGLATVLCTTKFVWWLFLLQAAGIGAFYFLLQRGIGPQLRRLWRARTAASGDGTMPASFLALLLVGLFTCCLVTHELGIFVIFGAFLFGTCLHQEASLVKAWRDRFSDVVLVAFVPIFFTNTGLNTRIGSLETPTAWLACAMVLLAAIVGKLGGCYLAGRYTGQTARDAGCIAALMNTRALMGLIAINVGLELKLLNQAMFAMLVIMALATTALCGPLLRWWLPGHLQSTIPDGNAGIKPVTSPTVAR
ncbi:MAG TPA: cation:proton antiporter [Verrucomicrobiae bacterium]|nr:cation:proton antiporter [Verrucomicrobiae bacterium]